MSYLISKEQSDTEQPIYIFQENERKVYLNSLYSPEKEVDRFLKKISDMEKKFVIMIGFGNGALLEGLLKSDMYKKNIHFLFIEPFSEVELRESSKSLLENNSKLSFYYAKDFDTLIFTKYIVKHMSVPITLQMHPNYSKIDNSIISDCLKIIHDGIETVQVFKNTQAKFATDWIIEPLLNTGSLSRAINIKSYEGKFSGERAILVASGPSLKKHMDFLKGNKEKFHIFAVGSALRALIANEIQPDYVVSLDAGKVNYDTHFEGIDYDGALIFETMSNSKIQENHKGPLIVSRTISDQVTLEFSSNLHTFTQPSPSVAILALQVIAYFGFSEVYFVGQDLALVDGEYYAAGIKHHDVVKTIKEEMLVENNQGKQIGTTRTLKVYLESFEALIKTLPRELTIYNLSEHGARIAGTRFIKENEIVEGIKAKKVVSEEFIASTKEPDNFIRYFVTQLLSLYKDVLIARKNLNHLTFTGVVNSKDVSKALKDFRKIGKHTILEKVILSNLKFLFNSIINNIQLLSSKQNYSNKEYLELLNELDKLYLIVSTYCDEIINDERLTNYN